MVHLGFLQRAGVWICRVSFRTFSESEITDHRSYRRQYVMTVAGTQTTGDLILHIFKAAQLQSVVGEGCKYLGLPLGSTTSFSYFRGEKPQAFPKLGTG